MGDQDWSEVSWDKRGSRSGGESKAQQVNRAMSGRSGAVVTTEKRFGAGSNQAARAPTTLGVNQKKLEEAEDPPKLAAPSVELRKVLQQERMKAQLSQAELAQMCNVKPSVIGDYEAGRGIPTPLMLGKIERALKAKNPELAPGTLTRAQKKG